MNSEYLITLIVPPSMEESMVDWLLSVEADFGFTSYPINGHSSGHEGLSLAEQVAGRRKHICFQVLVLADDLPARLEKLKLDFKGVGLHYWVSPIIESGYI